MTLRRNRLLTSLSANSNIPMRVGDIYKHVAHGKVIPLES